MPSNRAYVCSTLYVSVIAQQTIDIDAWLIETLVSEARNLPSIRQWMGLTCVQSGSNLLVLTKARQGKARQGKARQGKARHVYSACQSEVMVPG